MSFLEEKEIELNNLQLDANNPRFVCDFDTQPLSSQDEILNKFQNRTNAEKAIEIKTLFDSMVHIGFIPVDKVVALPIENSDQYLVIEGNRRVAAAKKIMQAYENKEKPFERNDEREIFESTILHSFTRIKCMVIKTETES